MLSPFRVFPAGEMPGEHQAESDPGVTSRWCWVCWPSRGMALKRPLSDFISSASRWGGGTNHQKRTTPLPSKMLRQNQCLRDKLQWKEENLLYTKDLKWEIQVCWICGSIWKLIYRYYRTSDDYCPWKAELRFRVCKVWPPGTHPFALQILLTDTVI